MSKIILVNEKDEIIGYKERNSILKDDMYRVSALWIENSKGDILLSQRSLSKKNSPGKWGPAVAGTVEKNETYETNVVKEAREEIGLINFKFTIGEKIMNNLEHKYFVQWFYSKIDLDINEFTLQKDEVENIKWFKKNELIKDLKINPDNYVKSIHTRMKQ